MTREPLLTTAGVTSALAAVLGLLVAFGLDLTEDQTTAILAVAAVVAPIVVGILTRPKVTPVAAPRSDAGVPLVEA